MIIDHLSILLPALCAGILVLSTHVVLGIQVLKRGIIFMDLAIAQIAALGAIFIHTIDGLEHIPFIHYLLPVIFAFIGAMCIYFCEKKFTKELEAIIGCIYVISASLSVLMLAHNPHAGEVLTQILSGQILWVTWEELLIPLFISITVLLVIWIKENCLNGLIFYLLFAIIVTTSLELVGVYLVFSSLILPALATNTSQPNQRVILGISIGILGYLLGLLFSAQWDLPAGTTIVLALSVTCFLYRYINHLIITKTDN